MDMIWKVVNIFFHSAKPMYWFTLERRTFDVKSSMEAEKAQFLHKRTEEECIKTEA